MLHIELLAADKPRPLKAPAIARRIVDDDDDLPDDFTISSHMDQDQAP
jgi:hypothetical protein